MSDPASDPAGSSGPASPRGPHRGLGLRERLAGALAARIRSVGNRSWGWRAAAPLAFVLAGALFVTSAVSAGGKDLRAGRYADLPGLVEAQADQVETLRTEQAQLVSQVDQLGQALGDVDADAAQSRADAVAGPAGLLPVQGPGLRITLDDAPDAVVSTLAADMDIDNLVVHQQDIQAVVNALWAGGAEAMTVQGQRIVSTTGVRCVGNTVVLHDVPYAPPYVITAIGPTSTMLGSLDQSPYIGFYLEAVEAFQLTWDVAVESKIIAPGYDGPTELSYARAVRPDVDEFGDPT